jgi:hypothetical protein
MWRERLLEILTLEVVSSIEVLTIGGTIWTCGDYNINWEKLDAMGRRIL